MTMDKGTYITNGIIKDTVWELILSEDNSITLNYVCDGKTREEDNPIIVDCGYGTRIEFGKPTVGGLRSSIPLTDKNGEIAKQWMKKE